MDMDIAHPVRASREAGRPATSCTRLKQGRHDDDTIADRPSIVSYIHPISMYHTTTEPTLARKSA
nr:unnamed protein product [Digitaria exilis]